MLINKNTNILHSVSELVNVANFGWVTNVLKLAMKTLSNKAHGLAHVQTMVNSSLIKPQRAFAMKLDGKVEVFINPVFKPSVIGGSSTEEEECLSVNGKFMVTRFKKGKLISQNQSPVKLSGFDARVCQHEIDHLDGILISDAGEKVTA